MPEIVPAIIAKSFEELEKKVKLVEPYVDWVQLDVMDGKFAPEKTWPYATVIPAEAGIQNNKKNIDSRWSLPRNDLRGGNDKGWRGNDKLDDTSCLPERLETKLSLEAHLMIEEPEREIDRWVMSGAKRILVHWEALQDDLRFKIYDLREKLAKKEIEFGVVLNLETPIDALDGLSEFFPPKADPPRAENHKSLFVIQLMSIAKIGYHGHHFDEKVIPKIRALKEGYPGVKIAVDGGINKETAKMALNAGADILVAGSAIFNSRDIEGAIKDLCDIE